MNRRLLPAVTSLVLLVLAAVLGWTLADRIASDVDISPLAAGEVRAQEETGLPGDLPEWTGYDASRLSAIVEAPLFIEGRRMPDDPRTAEATIAETREEPQESEAPVAAPEVDLIGVLIAPPGSKALVAARGTGEESWVGIEARLGPWTVERIGDDHMILRHGDETRRLDLHRGDRPVEGGGDM